MTLRIAICQPHYLPWIGAFEMIDRVDAFWCLDDVDFIKREWKNRNRIRKRADTAAAKWLSVPVRHDCQRATPMRSTAIGEEHDWRRRHLDAFADSYRRAPFGDEALELLRAGLAQRDAFLADLNLRLLKLVCDYLGITTPLERTSSLGIEGRKTERLLAVCRAVGADAYLANNGSAGYLETGRFADEGIACRFQDYEHPVYAQSWDGDPLPFLSHLSILDLIANHGPASLAVVREGRP